MGNFVNIMKIIATMCKYSSSQFLTTIGIQHGPRALTKSKATYNFLKNSGKCREITS